MKVIRDRAYDLQIGRVTMNPNRRACLEAKVRKDKSDMIALLDPSPTKPIVSQSIDSKLFNQISDIQGLDSKVEDSLKKLNEDDEAILFYGRGLTREKLRTWIDQLS